MNATRSLPAIPRSTWPCICGILLFLSVQMGCAASSQAGPAAAAPPPGPPVAGKPLDGRELALRLYPSDETAPLWLAGDKEQARLALRLLADAPLHGLEPSDYAVDGLASRLDRLDSPAAAATFERDLSTAVLQFMADLHLGRTQTPYRPASGAIAEFDPVERLLDALRTKRLEQAMDAAAPANPLYQRVKTALGRYRDLARLYPEWTALPFERGSAIAAGSNYDGAALLRERLRLLGDLGEDATDAGASGPGYTSELASAVRQFQARHGLEEDGVLGKDTMAALSVPLTHRVMQLELTLERLRWIPPQPKGRMIVINLPAYRLWAFDNRETDTVQPLEMRVIVGQAARTPTPLFIGQMRYLELNPYWNVPRSIVLEEIIPALARNPAYLGQHRMELVSQRGGVLPDEAGAALASLRAGTARVRQRPGAMNALGELKFAMPNPMNIYLHSTSSKELFNRTRRDLSHGCIRVEHPIELAQFVLADPGRWDAGALKAAIRTGQTRRIDLDEVVPVVLFYATAVVDRHGRALFTQDVYGHDQRLIRVLHER
ncbi:L,D-transpeptidase family protein [Massilia niastensis]|uniref:L,D-transpeptidase family protein n=1 Tax=Massilia niastensis TaxID=544911 RepID=UPI00146DC8CA|nr:L,D-transpeptidase family protein [Massilia niastensis]